MKRGPLNSGLLPGRQLFHNAVHVGIARAKAPRQKISATLHNALTINYYFKLAGLSRDHGCVNPKPLFDFRRETRGLLSIATSGRTVDDLDVHGNILSLSAEADNRKD